VPIPHRIEVVHFERFEASNVEKIKSALKQSLDEKLEGIIIKRVFSMYELNVRGGGWFKVKADYDESMSDTLDLVVLGGFYGDQAETGIGAVNSFLVGVPKIMETTVFKTVVKVSTGLSQTQLMFVRNQLKDSVVPSSGTLPEWFGQWEPAKGCRPDLIFSPWIACVVFEVKAAEITYSSEFSSGYSLRFPRILKLRTDKTWTECTTFDELREMASVDPTKNRIFIQNLKSTTTTSPESSDKKRKRKTAENTGPSIIAPASQPCGNVDVVSLVKPLEHVSVYIVNGSSALQLAQNLGASIHHQYQPGDYIVAEKDDVRVGNICKVASGVNVWGIAWLKECELRGHFDLPDEQMHAIRCAVKQSQSSTDTI
jgi:hypothetical protein